MAMTAMTAIARSETRPAWWREFEREREAARQPPSCLPGDGALVARFRRDVAAMARLFQAGRVGVGYGGAAVARAGRLNARGRGDRLAMLPMLPVQRKGRHE